MLLLGVGSLFFIIGGVVFKMFPPKKINHIYGWRTSLAMKNQDTWEYAQKNGSNIFMVSGLILIFIGIISNMFLGMNDNIQFSIMLITTLVTIVAGEIQMRKIFNKDGSRK